MTCRDIYGETLRKGDRVIGILSELCGLTGIISNIKELNGISYITISDEQGNTIITEESKFFTTSKRFKIHNALKYKYYLNCLDSNFYPYFVIPLTNKIGFDYDIDDKISLVYLDVIQKKENYQTSNHLLSLRSEEDTTLFHYNDCDFIKNIETQQLCWPGGEDITFKDKSKLYKIIKEIINYVYELNEDTTIENIKTKIKKF